MFNTKSKNLHFAHFDIAGFSYWEGCMVMNQLKIGDEVQLVREENNKFDPYAVAIMFDGYKLGYIPRTNNEQFCALMDQGHSIIFEAHIHGPALGELGQRADLVVVPSADQHGIDLDFFEARIQRITPDSHMEHQVSVIVYLKRA